MSEGVNFVRDLAIILTSAGVFTIICRALKQPTILGYIIAGFIIGPHMGVFGISSMETVELWSDIGIIFLMFGLGLEFSFKKLLGAGTSALVTAGSKFIGVFVIGYVVGQAMGWTGMESIFLAGLLSMSSTMVVVKSFSEMKLTRKPYAAGVFGTLVVEDLIAILLMVLLSTLAVAGQFSGGEMLLNLGKLIFFLVLWFVVGIYLIPTILKRFGKYLNNEVLLVTALGLCFGMVALATGSGFSSALGAFMMGSILAETVESERIDKLIAPIKDLFGAIFFVSVGMLVDPDILMSYAAPIMALVLTILVGQAVFGSFAFMLGGESLKSAMRCGFSMAQIGEFSFIIASLGLSLGVISDFLYPVVVAVSVITTFLTPYMIRLATPAYAMLEQRLPSKLIGLLNHLSMSHPNSQETSLWKRLLVQIGFNTLVYTILSLASIAIMFTFVQPFMQDLLPGENGSAYGDAVTGVLTVLLISPFLRAMVMKKNRSEEWRRLWAESNRNRLPLLFTILARAMIALGLIFYICNALGRFSNALVITLGIIVLALIIISQGIKRRSIQLEQLFINNLRSREIEAEVHGKRRPLYEGKLLDRDIHIADFDLPADSLWMGQTLKQLDLGRKYGVHVSSILRGGHRLNIPDGDYILFPGDRLQVIGSDAQLASFGQALSTELLGEDTELEKREMKLRQLIIGPDSPFIGKTLQDSGIRGVYSCMVVGLEEGKENLSPFPPTRQFEEGDIIWVVGEEEALRALLDG